MHAPRQRQCHRQPSTGAGTLRLGLIGDPTRGEAGRETVCVERMVCGDDGVWRRWDSSRTPTSAGRRSNGLLTRLRQTDVGLDARRKRQLRRHRKGRSALQLGGDDVGRPCARVVQLARSVRVGMHTEIVKPPHAPKSSAPNTPGGRTPGRGCAVRDFRPAICEGLVPP
jgi:hypothetical protein